MEIETIVITGRIYKQFAQRLVEKKLEKDVRFLREDEVSVADLLWADAYVGFGPTKNFTADHLKWVHSLGAGVDRFLLGRTWNSDVLLTRTICSFGQKISEYCLSYMLRSLMHHDTYKANQKQKQWDPVVPIPLVSQTVVIYGAGEIGQAIARTLSFFGATVYGVSLSGKHQPFFKKVTMANEVATLLPSADWIINTLPLTKATKHFFDQAFFHQLQNASFINVGRGATVDDAALLEALETKRVKTAVLDVFAEEPLQASSPLWTNEKITITPHISAITFPEEAVDCFLETLARMEANQPLKNQVNIEKGY